MYIYMYIYIVICWLTKCVIGSCAFVTTCALFIEGRSGCRC